MGRRRRRSKPKRFEFGFSGRSDDKARIKQRVDAMDILVQPPIMAGGDGSPLSR
jgi:hypothetical protein